MGVAMAGMLVSWLNPLPDAVWAVMFGAGTGWFGWRAWRGRQQRTGVSANDQSPYRHHVPHLVMCGAMVYMLLAAGAVVSATHPGMTMGGLPAAGRFPLVALVLAVFMVGYVMWQADRLPALAQPSTPRTAPAGALALVPLAAAGGQATEAHEPAPDPPARQRRQGMSSRRLMARDNMPPAGPPDAVPPPSGLLPDRHGRNHGLHADPHALSTRCGGVQAPAPPAPR